MLDGWLTESGLWYLFRKQAGFTAPAGSNPAPSFFSFLLPLSVMVAQQILDLRVQVQVLEGQPFSIAESVDLEYDCIRTEIS